MSHCRLHRGQEISGPRQPRSGPYLNVPCRKVQSDASHGHEAVRAPDQCPQQEGREPRSRPGAVLRVLQLDQASRFAQGQDTSNGGRVGRCGADMGRVRDADGSHRVRNRKKVSVSYWPDGLHKVLMRLVRARVLANCRQPRATSICWKTKKAPFAHATGP